MAEMVLLIPTNGALAEFGSSNTHLRSAFPGREPAGLPVIEHRPEGSRTSSRESAHATDCTHGRTRTSSGVLSSGRSEFRSI